MTEKQYIREDYLPIIYSLPKEDIKGKPSPSFSHNIDQPKTSLGFHHYYHQSKGKMAITEKFNGKKKVYYIINKFEHMVDDYNESIANVAKTYFNINTNKMPNILSRAFYKLWEILLMFDLIDPNQKDFVSAHLAEGPGSFIQATIFFRDMWSKFSKNDKYNAVTLHSERADGIKSHVPKIEKDFIDYYAKEKPVRLNIHKTVGREEARLSTTKDNGDLIDPKTRRLFGGKFNDNKAHFVTADGGFDWNDENKQEQESLKLILAQIITAIQIQAVGGHFVCKFYETVTNTVTKIIGIVSTFYEKIYFIKPLTSRASNSEKYMVCMGFIKGSTKELEEILDEMIKTKLNIVDVYPEYNISKDLTTTFKKMNIQISNIQFININDMIVFITKENYRGEEYTKRRQDQIEASKFWINKYFIKSFDQIKKIRDNLLIN